MKLHYALPLLALTGSARSQDIIATVTQLTDGFCFCSGSESHTLSASDLPYDFSQCGSDLEVVSFDPSTNIVEVDGDGGSATIDLDIQNFVHTDRGQCVTILHVSVEDEEPVDLALLGCFGDASERALSGSSLELTNDMTPEVCADFCVNEDESYTHFGVQFGKQCFCGSADEFAQYGTSTACTVDCSGDDSRICGGRWSNSVFTISTGYDEDLAYDAINYVDIADSDDPASLLPDFSNVTVFEFEPPQLVDTEVQAYAGVSTSLERIVVAFRGSNSAEQLLVQFLESVSLDSWDEPDGFCDGCNPKVISYFSGGSEGLLADGLRSHLTSLVSTYPDYEVLLAGYSLGGALANVVAVTMRLEGVLDENVQVYTVGQPRVGNQDFVDNYDIIVPSTFRIVYNRDVVVRLPPCNINGCDETGPNHVGMEVWYLESEEEGNTLCGKVICAGREDADCCRSLDIRVSVTDHQDGYFTVLDNNGFCGEGTP